MNPLPQSVAVGAPSPVPLRRGGAERLWDGLVDGLLSAGVEADLVKVPVRELALADLMDAYEQFALLDLSHVDAVVTGKYPAWMVDHPHHVVWMLHPLRGLYDSYRPEVFEDRRLPDDPDLLAVRDLVAAGPRVADPFEVMDLVRSAAERLGPDAAGPDGALALPGPFSRAVVQLLDRWALDGRRVRRHAAISQVVARRDDYFPPEVTVRVVHPPSALRAARPAELGRNFLVVSRLERIKRVDLAIAAVQRLDHHDVTLTVVGEGADRERLQDLAGDDPRITFAGRVDDDALRQLYATARAVVVTPEREDFGYVTLEAHHHGRPVITVSDAGGPTELVADGENGLVVDPDPALLARAMAELLDDTATAERLARAGWQHAAQVTWERAVDDLLGAPQRSTASPDPRAGRLGRLVAVSTYPVGGAAGGGPERAQHLLQALADDGWDVELLDLTVDPVRATPDGGRTELPGTGSAGTVGETTVPYSQRHHDAEARLRLVTGDVAVTDVAASVLWPATPVFVRELVAALDGASGVVLVQPYLYPAIAALAPDLPVVYDSHNHEHRLKADMLPDNEGGRWLLDRVRECEGAASRAARLVVVTTDNDRAALATDYSVDPDRVSVVPNGVDTAAVPFTPLDERHVRRTELLTRYEAGPGVRRVAVFVGSGHAPNIEAGRVLLRLAGDLPDTLFLLAGRHSLFLEPRRTASNVRLLGEVGASQLADLLAVSDVALNPMTTGGGSNLKLLGYLAAGVPVVSTELGARGLDGVDRLLTVAPVERFAEAVRAALDGPDAERVAAARAAVEARSDWSVIGRRFAALVREVVE
ncbi:MAG: glycosyltransferase family 4 protein, partial [Actinomycetes bacterium]